MERDYKNEKRAFKIVTDSNTCNNKNYIVIAHNYTEAEHLYWSKIKGYYEIISIEVIRNIDKVACCDSDLDKEYKIE